MVKKAEDTKRHVVVEDELDYETPRVPRRLATSRLPFSSTQILYTLLLVAAFLIGYLLARVQGMENGAEFGRGGGGTTAAAGTGTTGQTGTAPASITKEQIVAWAGEIGLDENKFTTCYDSGKYDDKIEQDVTEGSSVGVSGTPAFLINGHLIVGALPYDVFKRAFDFTLAGGDWNNPDDTVADLTDGDDNNGEVAKVKKEVSESDIPTLGNANAQITMVEFSDFECPFCKRYFDSTYPQIKKDYIDTGKVKVVFKHYPLSFHPSAKPMAVAGECANEQGKFWEMHDKMFASQG